MNKLFILAALAIMAAGWSSTVIQAAQDITLKAKNWDIQSTPNSTTLPQDKDWRKNVPPAKGKNSFWYQQKITIPAEWQGRRIYLDFSRIEGDAIIFVNGEKIGELLRPGGEVEITAQAKTGSENTALIFVTRDYTDISRGFEQDRLRYICRNHMTGTIPMEKWGVGISADVLLLSRPAPAAIADVAVETSWRKKEITLNIEIDASKMTDSLTLAAEILDADGKEALSFAGKVFSAQAGRSVVKVAAAWENPQPWELDSGYVYTAKVKLLKDGTIVDESSPISFGFREIWAEGRKLYLNGHESRLRLAFMHSPLTFGDSSPKGLMFARLIGYNAGYIQAHPELWWRGCGWAKEVPVFSEELLRTADEQGFGILLPAPSVAFLGPALLTDEAARRDYEREMRLHMRHYRNHPSILSWIVSMNSVGFATEAIAPQNMGMRFDPKRLVSGQAGAVAKACEIAKEYDPTRLAYAHADGNLGDIASTNCYLNFAPLQERVEWPKAWHESGNMPYQMAEFGPPYRANFWKGKRFLPTEYFAMYFGDRAYEQETNTGLKMLIEGGITPKNMHGTEILTHDNGKSYPVYWDFLGMFVKNTNRSFRIWGVNGGWSYWSMSPGYGKPAGKTYEDLPLYTERPPWANPNFDFEREGNQPLLVCLTGWKSHTDKTHIYYSGEDVKKSVSFVWDGPGKTSIESDWTLSSLNGKELASGKIQETLQAGDIKTIPFNVTAPAVNERTDYTIKLVTRQDGKPVEGDSFSITVFPKFRPLTSKSKIALYDPKNKSGAWLKAAGLDATPIGLNADLANYQIMIIGREAIQPGEDLPFNSADIKNGLKVLILEQQPAGWQGLGFRSNETMPRLVFPTAKDSPLMDGLALTDLSYWRGSPNLLPEGQNQPSNTRHAPKWTNTHAIASSIPQIPRAVGFSPLISAEFDLDYAPLLEWRYGKGMVVLCSLDLTDRVPASPAATTVFRNIITYLESATVQNIRAVVFSGSQNTQALLEQLGVDAAAYTGKENPAETLLIVDDGKIPAEELAKFTQVGGTVLFLPQTAEALSEYGLKTAPQNIQRVSPAAHPLLRNIGLNLLRWRDVMSLTVFDKAAQPVGVEVLLDGLLAVRKMGKGEQVFCQLSPNQFANKYLNDKNRAEAIDLSVIRAQQFLARLLGNLGAISSEKIAQRMMLCLGTGSQYTPIRNWNVLGPYRTDSDNGEQMLNTKFSAEDMAKAGDANPNITFPYKDGKVFDWRTTVNPDRNGKVDLGELYNLESQAVGYAVSTVTSQTERWATLRVGCDWRMILWVNGNEVFRTLDGKNRSGAYFVRVKLKKGENTISLKLGSGSKGFSFYLDLNNEEKAPQISNVRDMEKVSYYAGSTEDEEFDPYFFTYW